LTLNQKYTDLFNTAICNTWSKSRENGISTHLYHLEQSQTNRFFDSTFDGNGNLIACYSHVLWRARIYAWAIQKLLQTRLPNFVMLKHIWNLSFCGLVRSNWDIPGCYHFLRIY